MHCRSNRHDVGSDLACSIIRKRKVQLSLSIPPTFLEQEETEVAAEEAGQSDATQAAVGHATAGPPAGKRRKSEERINPEIDGVRLGSRSHSTDAAPVDVAVDGVDALLPTRLALPELRLGRFAFADRLGLFLAHFEEGAAGSFPRPEQDYVRVFQRMRVAEEHNTSAVVRASPSFHGRASYSFVEIDSGHADNTMWFGQVLLLFSCTHNDEELSLALISYLYELPAGAVLPCKRVFRWHSEFPDCVELRRIRRSVLMLPLPGVRDDNPHAPPRFALIDHGPCA